MGIRETLNENPVVTTGLTVVLMLGAIVFLVMRWLNPSLPSTKFANKCYYSDDDGTTWYVDDAKNIPPYDHNGKQAYRAILFRCTSSKKVFVQRLEGYDDDTKARIQQQISSGTAPLAAQYMYSNEGMLIKKPKDKDWVKVQITGTDPTLGKKWAAIMKPACPDGSVGAVPVGVDENVKPE